MTSADIIQALRVHHGVGRKHPMNAEPWVFFEEFIIGTAGQCDTRIDVLTIETGRRARRIAYEIKASRSDFRKELATPRKREDALKVANVWVLATPPGLVSKDELPVGAGLVEITSRGVSWKVPGICTKPLDPDYFVQSLARRVFRAEQRVDAA